ncbi:MAG: hypothetical protein A3H91_05380 [Gammaproteobacteria bacterium RIFCSPLOWO2_02_FULL_61_13]|nr:MAG: hypothetical protein A3H91_05380 [Gammaproteobacteria bacterium RIFCSPLOWO2_02_FULL_61_13]
MFCVSIMYPNTPSSTFNLKHYLETHMPLGIGLLERHAGMVPQRIEVQTPGPAPDGAAAPYHCICNLYFEHQADVEKFAQLLQNEVAARLLQADWPNYTAAAPVAQFGICRTLDAKALAAAGQPLIEAALRNAGT